MKRILAICLGVLVLAGWPAHPVAADSRAALAEAMRQKDLGEIQRLSEAEIQRLGGRAGIPDVAPEFRRVPKNAAPLAATEIKTAFKLYLLRLQGEQWWRGPGSPQEMDQPLRAIASVVEGCLAARAAGCDEPEELLKIAGAAGAFLLRAQTEGDRGVFPFPAWTNKTGRLGELSKKFLHRAKQEGRTEQWTHNGWIVDDAGGGDLQFDNGVCGVSMLRLFAATRDQKYLRAAQAAADWAVAQPVVPNWNYNSFSVGLLSEVFRITKEPRYLNTAREKMRLGILPGQLKSGPHAGRWFDPHNARLVYHFILLRGLAAYCDALPADDPDLAKATGAVELGLGAWLPELTKQGVANGETVLEFLSRVRLSAHLRQRLDSLRVNRAWELVGGFCAEQVRTGKLPVAPGAWGLYLQSIRALE